LDFEANFFSIEKTSSFDSVLTRTWFYRSIFLNESQKSPNIYFYCYRPWFDWRNGWII